MEKSLNNLAIRRANKKRVLKLLYRSKGLTKQQISLSLGLSVPTVSQIMKEFEAEGLAKDVGRQKSSGGRCPAVNSIVTTARHSLGIGISKHHIRLALLDLSLEVVDKLSIETYFENSPEYWDKVSSLAKEFLNKNQVQAGTLLGVGMSLPGIVSPDTMTADFAPTLSPEPLALEGLKKLFPADLRIANDATLAAKAEVWFRNETETIIYLLLNKGVGGAIVAQNTTLPFGNRAAEFGHMTIVNNGKLCSCGRKGCLEAYCSSAVLVEESGCSLEEFFEGVKNKNKQYIRIWHRYLGYLAAGINNLHNIFDSDIIIGGEMSKYVKAYGEVLYKELEERSSFKKSLSYLKIGNYGEFDAAIGAALIHIESFLDNDIS